MFFSLLFRGLFVFAVLLKCHGRFRATFPSFLAFSFSFSFDFLSLVFFAVTVYYYDCVTF